MRRSRWALRAPCVVGKKDLDFNAILFTAGDDVAAYGPVFL
tara:strand:+ start:768 stop:890 length:123 start_codon:yes stop_codon:yes gene_type:complete